MYPSGWWSWTFAASDEPPLRQPDAPARVPSRGLPRSGAPAGQRGAFEAVSGRIGGGPRWLNVAGSTAEDPELLASPVSTQTCPNKTSFDPWTRLTDLFETDACVFIGGPAAIRPVARWRLFGVPY